MKTIDEILDVLDIRAVKTFSIRNSLTEIFAVEPPWTCWNSEAASLIRRQQVEIELVKRERDAAIDDMKIVALTDCCCDVCTHGQSVFKCQHAICGTCNDDAEHFEWRGLCAENGG